MKIRALTYGMSLTCDDFEKVEVLEKKFEKACSNLSNVVAAVTADGYEVQTVRFSFNRLEDWLDLSKYEKQLTALAGIIATCGVASHVALGCCTTVPYIQLVPRFLTFSSKFNVSAHIPQCGDPYTVPDSAICAAAAKVCLQLSAVGDGSENFRFCIGFNCQPGTPFFPISFFHRYVIRLTLFGGFAAVALTCLFGGSRVQRFRTNGWHLGGTGKRLLPLPSVSWVCGHHKQDLHAERCTYHGQECSVCAGPKEFKRHHSAGACAAAGHHDWCLLGGLFGLCGC